MLILCSVRRRSWSICENLNIYNIDDRAILRVVGPSGGFTNFGMTFYPVRAHMLAHTCPCICTALSCIHACM